MSSNPAVTDGVISWMRRMFPPVAGCIVLVSSLLAGCADDDGASTTTERGCLASLRRLDSAVENASYALALHDGAVAPSNEVVKFLVSNRVPVCPSGGSYSWGIVGRVPTCSLHGDLLARHGDYANGRRIVP